MGTARLDLAVLCVWATVILGCAGSLEDPRQQTPVHFIYPRTGRLFHADFVRDNEIFRSLERTNFMRRGPFAGVQRSGRAEGAETESKKHVYIGEGRIPVEPKKDVERGKDIPAKSVLFKVSKVVVKDPIVEKRFKRDAIPKDIDVKKEDNVVNKKHSTSTDNREYDTQTQMPANINEVNNEENVILVENKVDCDNNGTVKNNDTDKTLFVHDSTRGETPVVVKTPAREGGDGDGDGSGSAGMKDTLRLYPVYRGVRVYYPQAERLVDSQQTSVKTDDSTGLQEEGRSRRPLKKLAFPLLLALKLKTAIMVPLILGLVGLISFKGLWSGLTALAIAAALGLKALVSGGGAKVLVHALPPPPPSAHVHHLPPPAVEYAEYWSRRNDDHNTYYSDYRPSSWS